MIISLIVAMDEKRGIGKDNTLPWRIRSDLQRFKALTMGHHIVMGRRTYETIGKPLPGRKMMVITHRKGYHAPGCLVVNSLQLAIKLARENGEEELFVIGGGKIFAESIDLAEKIYLTRVNTVVDADVYFPSYRASEWKTTHTEKSTPDEYDEYGTEYKILIRNHPQQG